MNLLILIGVLIGAFLIYAYVHDRKSNWFRCPHGVSYRIDSDVDCIQCQMDKQRNADQKKKFTEQLKIVEQEAKQREIELRQQEMSNIRNLAYLQELHPAKFEVLICELYRRLGYRVSETPYAGDHGVDGFLYKDDKTYILQCKRFTRSKLGAPVLRDLLGTIVSEEADGGILVTTSFFTENAISFAGNSGQISLVDGNTLIDLIRANVAPGDLLPKELTAKWAKIDVIPSRCPRCGSKTKKRVGPYGEFYGCIEFPNCRWTMGKPSKDELKELFDTIDEEYSDEDDDDES